MKLNPNKEYHKLVKNSNKIQIKLEKILLEKISFFCYYNIEK